MAEKIMGVYYIKNTVTGQIYVGSSVDINRRLNGHLSALRKGKHVNCLLSRAWLEVGEAAFVTGTLEVVCNFDDLIGVEQAWIDYAGSYNIAPAAGSTYGMKQSAEFKRKQSARCSGQGNPMFGKKRPEIAELMKKVHGGRTLTEEHKRKCSESLKGKGAGKPLSEETKAKISAANKGRKLTDEQRSRLAEVHKNRSPISNETREKLRAASTGKRHTDDTRQKISMARVGVPLNLSDEERSARAERAKNRTHTNEQRQAISNRQRGVRRPPEVIAKMSAAMKGKRRTEESRRKQGASVSGANNPRFGIPMSDETKRKISETKLRMALERKAP